MCNCRMLRMILGKMIFAKTELQSVLNYKSCILNFGRNLCVFCNVHALVF